MIAGLSDPVEAWQLQIDGLSDRYHVTAFDNRGAGRTPLPSGPLSVASMADDAAALLRTLDVPDAHVAGSTGIGSRGLPRASAPCWRRSSRGSTPSAHAQSTEAFQSQLAGFMTHDSLIRLSDISAPTLVLAGEIDITTPPRFGRVVAEKIPDALFEVLPGEARQPFQEAPDAFNDRVDAFWRTVERK